MLQALAIQPTLGINAGHEGLWVWIASPSASHTTSIRNHNSHKVNHKHRPTANLTPQNHGEHLNTKLFSLRRSSWSHETKWYAARKNSRQILLQLGFIQSPLSKKYHLDLTWAPNNVGGSKTVVEDRCVEFPCSSFDSSCDSLDYTAPPYYVNAKM